jgi:1,4-dihydroxy-6-naphthoate synthase
MHGIMNQIKNQKPESRNQTFTLGFSPCPNDTFIFDALVNNKIDTGGLSFEVMLEDVQTLNDWAKQGRLDISKISYGVLPQALDKYLVLNSGGALGKGVGPLLITKSTTGNPQPEPFNGQPTTNYKLQTTNRIAIPGKDTTAHLLFTLAFPEAKNKKFMLFHEIEDAVLKGDVDAGVIIHENRFTYQDKGLVKIMDLGSYWEQTVKLPIPLGGIVVKRSIDIATQKTIDRLIRESLQYAFNNYPQITGYVRQHSQEMDEAVMKQHIDLYVNNYSLALGDEGKKAVRKFLEVYAQLNGSVADNDTDVFID